MMDFVIVAARDVVPAGAIVASAVFYARCCCCGRCMRSLLPQYALRFASSSSSSLRSRLLALAVAAVCVVVAIAGFTLR